MTIPLNTAPGGHGVSRWGDYELLDEVGRGAFGAVYRSYHPTLQQEVALKLVPVPAHDARAIDRAIEEARRLASVRHQHVVVVHDARYLDGYVGICMEFVRGLSLEDIVAERGPCDPEEANTYIRALAGALSAVHRARIVHNDVKAKNAMRETGGRVVLMDFGAGRRLPDPKASTGFTLIGTPLYMAPEIFKLQDPTAVSDIYSLGVLWFYLLTGDYPIVGDTLQSLADAHARGRRRFLGDFRDDVPDYVQHVLARALEPDPAARYQTSGALIDDLNVHARSFGSRVLGPASSVAGEVVQQRVPVRRRFSPTSDLVLFVSAAALAILITIGGIGYMASQAYGIMFGLQEEIARESPRVWFETGSRTLPLILVSVAIVEIAWATASLCWRITARNSALVGTWSERTSQALMAATRRTGLDDGASVATLLLIAHCAIVLTAGWFFSDVIQAFTTPVVERILPNHALLSVGHDDRWILFRQVMCLLTLAGGYGWYAVLRHWSFASIGFARVAAGLLLTVASLALGTVPWRIVNESTFDLAMFGPDRCFILREMEGRVHLYCPGGVEKTRIVAPGDTRLVRLGTTQNLFSAVAGPRPPGGS